MAVPVNSALDAAVAALTAQPYPWFVPVYSIRLTDPAMYQTFIDTYGFGTPVVIGLSPDDAAVLTGVPIVLDPSFGAQQVRPEIFVHPDALNVLGVPITTAESGGTIMVGYTNELGHYDRVIWQWQCDVQLFPVPVLNPDDGGKYEQEVVTWTGDGTSNRLIATTFSLASGVVAIWGCGGANGVGTDQVNFFRSNGGMLGTALMGITVDPIVGQGIVAFEAGGFRVTDGSFIAPFANTVGVPYAAVVLRDTTTTNRFLRVGRYVGDAGIGPGFQVITTPGSAEQLTHVWIWGATVGYKSQEFPGLFSVALANGASSPEPVDYMITSLGVQSFEVVDATGAQGSVNSFNVKYDYVALNANAEFLAGLLFASRTGTGSGSPPTLLTALGFTPGLAFGRQGGTVYTGGAVFRGPTHTGSSSTFCSAIGGNNNIPATGITAIGAGSADFDIVPAPTGDPFYGWFFKTGEIDFGGSSTPGPPYNPVAVPSGDYSPNGGLTNGGLGGLGVGHTGPCGCSLLE